jgi:hypothetical protein
MTVPDAGIVLAVDLAGRKLLQVNASRSGTVRHALTKSIPSGLLIVKFEAKDFSAKKIVPVM